ncbi:MAG: single-stranded-DNA-specific exonuclease RecJ [Kofleriaceae bacterium]|nr:single-stranded-DNA-specific exonuclease RecJ [Kofleriaceae bacterium]MBP9857869.1 single-stranded-DNA-specific exonuclease RecJ [Kofleriaceae bacterium]
MEVRPIDDTAAARLAARLRVRAATARCLLARGVDGDAATDFLAPRLAQLRKPEGDLAMAGFATAADRVTRAVLRRERIAVFGDYDVDGVTTAALLTSFLRGCGADVVARVARRDEGYGFTPTVAAELLGHGPGLIITGDCGTSDLAAIDAARAAAVDVVVVDHHTVPDRGAHPAVALVNPHRADSAFPFRAMASVGIAFYLAAAVRTRLAGQGHFTSRPAPDPRELLDLVALGTIADLVPLVGENRILASAGLKLASERRRPGVAALLAAAGVGPERPVDEHVLSWKLAPRLNAPGRLGDAAPALDLLLADDRGAAACADALESANLARRAAQDVAVAEALAAVGEASAPAIVVASERWLPGVVGIVAAKLVDRFARPAFVIAIDAATGLGRGSARSVAGVDLYRTLAACAPLLERFGGHAAAAGLTVRADAVDALRDALGAAVLAAGSGPAAPGPLADGELSLAEVDAALVAELDGLGPFGQGNPEPRFVSRGLEVVASRRVGDGSHGKLELRCPRTSTIRGAIGFGLGDRTPEVGTRVDVAYRPTASSWQGKVRVELEVREVSVVS